MGRFAVLFYQNNLPNMRAIYCLLFYLSSNVLRVLATPTPSQELAEFRKHTKAFESSDPNRLLVTDWIPAPIPDKVLTQYGLHNTTTSKAYPAFPSLKQLRKHVNICRTNTDSPLTSDVQFLIEYLNEGRWNWYCHQSYGRIPYCIRLASHGTAAVGVCGAYRHSILCQGAGKAVSAVFEDCKCKINDDVRVGGIAINWGVRGSIVPDFRGLIIYHT